MRLLNFNFTPGPNATPQAVWAELGKMFVQRLTGLKPTGPAKSDRPQVDVREFVKDQAHRERIERG